MQLERCRTCDTPILLQIYIECAVGFALAIVAALSTEPMKPLNPTAASNAKYVPAHLPEWNTHMIEPCTLCCEQILGGIALKARLQGVHAPQVTKICTAHRSSCRRCRGDICRSGDAGLGS